MIAILPRPSSFKMVEVPTFSPIMRSESNVPIEGLFLPLVVLTLLEAYNLPVNNLNLNVKHIKTAADQRSCKMGQPDLLKDLDIFSARAHI